MDVETSLTPCPFCEQVYKGLGSHLRHCSRRDKRDYSMYLSQKTLKKKRPNRSTSCPSCGKQFVRLDVHLRTSGSCKQQLERPTASSQLEHDAGPQCCEWLSEQAMPLPSTQISSQIRSSQSTIVSATSLVEPTPKPLPPFKTPDCNEQWEKVDSELAQCLIPAVRCATSPEHKNSILCQEIYNYMVSRFGTKRVTRNKKSRRSAHERTLKN